MSQTEMCKRAARACDIPLLLKHLDRAEPTESTYAATISAIPSRKPKTAGHHPSQVLKAALNHPGLKDPQHIILYGMAYDGSGWHCLIDHLLTIVGGCKAMRAFVDTQELQKTSKTKLAEYTCIVLRKGDPEDFREFVEMTGAGAVSRSMLVYSIIRSENEKTFKDLLFRPEWWGADDDLRESLVYLVVAELDKSRQYGNELAVALPRAVRRLQVLNKHLCGVAPARRGLSMVSAFFHKRSPVLVCLDALDWVSAVHALLDLYAVVPSSTARSPLNVRDCGFFAFMLLLSVAPGYAWKIRRKLMSGRWWEDERKSYECQLGCRPDHEPGYLFQITEPRPYWESMGNLWQSVATALYDPQFLMYLERLLKDRRFTGVEGRIDTLTRIITSLYNAPAAVLRDAALMTADNEGSRYIGDLSGLVRRTLRRVPEFRQPFFDMVAASVTRCIVGRHGVENRRRLLGCDRMVALWDAMSGFRPGLASRPEIRAASAEVRVTFMRALHAAKRGRNALIALQTAFRRARARLTPVVGEGGAVAAMAPPRTAIAMAPPKKFGASFLGGSAFLELTADLYRGPIPPPHHATPVTLAGLVSKPFYATPKADGVSFVGALPAEAYPPPPPGVEVCAEVVEVRGAAPPKTLYLVYDVLPGARDGPDDGGSGSDDGGSDGEDALSPFGETPSGLDLMERLNLLLPPDLGGWGDAGIHLKIHAHSVVVGELLKSEHPVVWAVKPVHLLPGAECLPVLDTPPITCYPNDGWVLSPAKLTMRDQLAKKVPNLKVKPAREMTADLDVRGTVMRCRYSGGEWVPREARPDKKEGNPPHLVQFLEGWHRHPWRPTDLAAAMKHSYYGGDGARSAEGYSVRAALRRHLRRAVRGARVGSVIDIGCGYGSLCPVDAGIDIDPVAIAAARGRHPERRYWLADVASLCCPVSGQPAPVGSYDTAICAHSLHNAAFDVATWEAWGVSLSKLGASVLVVAYVSADVFGESGRIEFGTSWAQKVKDGDVPGTCLARRSFAWNASAAAPVFEPFVTEGAVVGLLAKHGWALRSVSDPDRCPVDGWDVWVEHTHVLTFVR